MVGLELSKSSYTSKKEDEFEKYCKKAMRNAIDLRQYEAKTELEFLSYLTNIFDSAIYGTYDSYGKNGCISLNIKTHYVRNAARVIWRRFDDIKKGNTELLKPCDFTNKSEAKKYAELIWNKYQYPWPEDWLKYDAM